MSSSDDDVPLGLSNGHRTTNGLTHKSASTIPSSVDRAMDKKIPSGGQAQPGISIRNGRVEEMDIDEPTSRQVNGAVTGKRKSRSSLAKSYKEHSSASDDEDDKPLSKKPRTSTKPQAPPESDSDDAPLLLKKTNGRTPVAAKKPPKMTEMAIGESEDSDVPLGVKLTKKKARIEEMAVKEAKAIEKKESRKPSGGAAKKRVKEESEEESPVKKKRQSNGTASATKKAKSVKKEDSDDDIPLSRKASAKVKAKPKSTASTPVKKDKKGKKATEEQIEEDAEAEAEEDEYRWWDDPTKGDGTIKWTTLEHNGVIFPPPYERLPKNVKLFYDGVPVILSPDAEEVAGFFGTMLNSAHNVENPTFRKNFFEDFTKVLKETGGATNKNGDKVNIKEFTKCDFKQIFEHYEAERARKKALPTAEKKALKAEKDEVESPYMYCTWDGRKQKVGNFRVEPPGLFRGRGEHPKTGKVKKRALPEQITINIGKGARVPPPPEGHQWKDIKHDQEGTWLAMWQENINGAYKYVMLAANSDVKGQSDFKKFEKARELKKHIANIRADYNRELKSERMADRQRATAVYLIDQFALRAGNEKGEDEADTVGCCSLKYEHVSLKPPNMVIFDFLGKDSIRFYDEVSVDPQVFKNLKIFKKAPKTEGDEIFDRLTTAGLNRHLQGYMTGLTAKVFRTYNASFTMAKLLREMKPTGTDPEKMKAYNDANKEVAILCNHKRTVAAGHEGQMEKLSERIKGVKYQRWRLKHMILDIDPKQKKKRGADSFELDEDIDKEWVKEHQAFLVDEQRQKIEKKFAKENEKLAAEGQKEMKQKELTERLKVADQLAAKFKKENKSNKVEAEGKGSTVEKMDANIAKINQRLETLMLQADMKNDLKEVALGTSKINYIDPRLTVVFSKKYDIPISKFFSKTLREKFEWAIKSVEEDWEF